MQNVIVAYQLPGSVRDALRFHAVDEWQYDVDIVVKHLNGTRLNRVALCANQVTVS